MTMKTIFYSILLSASVSLAANQEVALQNKARFISQDVSNPASLPVPLHDLQDLKAQFSIDLETPYEIQKKFSGQITFQDLKAEIEIYYFRRQATQEKYFSQQIQIKKNSHLIAKCSSYFALDQKFLVPGVCSGVDPQTGLLYGLSIYR
jgi:hypothetical protein